MGWFKKKYRETLKSYILKWKSNLLLYVFSTLINKMEIFFVFDVAV